MAIKNECPTLYIAAEILNKKFEEHLKLAHCDEILLTKEYEYGLIATASSGQGYSSVIKSFISEDADSGILIPESFIGKTYRDFKDYSWNQRQKNGMLVGILLNSGNFHLRRMEAIREAQKNPNISAIIEGLQKVKSLVSNDPVFTPPNDFVVPKNAKAIYVRGSRNA